MKQFYLLHQQRRIKKNKCYLNTYRLFLFLMFSFLTSVAFSQAVTGRVVVNDTAIVGATVQVKGSKAATQTDGNGRFSVTAAPNATLIISSIGYTSQEIKVDGRASLTIQMKAALQKMDEVVVIGYGTQKKVTVTGAVSSVKGDELKVVPQGSIANTLAGRMPGLIAKNTSGEPGNDDSRLLIRGLNTTGDNSPLIVVDGVADRAGGFSRIDVNDIESVSILKDASAAIYGSRAANGVILVTTKRGRNGKTSISYSTNYGLRSPTVLPKMVDAADYAVAINDITRLIDKNPVPTYTPAEIQKFRDGSDPINYPNVDPIKSTLKDYSLQYRHNVTVSGGSENVKYFTSLGYQYENNIFRNSASNYKQYNLRSNVDIQATNFLRFYVNLALRQEDRNAPFDGRGTGEIWRNIIQGDPRQLIEYPNGLRHAVTSGGYNPLTQVDGSTGYMRDRVTYINTDLGFALDLSAVTKGLSADGRLSVDKSDDMNKAFNTAWVLYSLNNVTNEYVGQQYGPTNATLNQSMNRNLGITSNARLLYTRSFNQVHNVSAFVGYEQYQSRYDYLQAQRQNFVSTAVDQIFAGDSKSATNDGSAFQSGRKNYFGRVDYSYKEKYLFQFNWRRDGSEQFAPGRKYGFFTGYSAGWRVSEENFFKQNLPVISFMKLRGSWGQVGNDKISLNGAPQQYLYLTQYTFGQNGIFGGGNPSAYTGVQQISTANPFAIWETGTIMNFGFESKLFRNALSFDFDLFKQKRKNILAQPAASVGQYTGITLPIVNDASCQSQGFEASLGYNKSFRDFRFNVGGNITYSKSKILNINEADGTPAWQRKTGKPIDASWLMYESIGIYKTASDLAKYPQLGNSDLGDLIFKDVNGDGKLDGNDQVRVSNTETPQIIYGATLGASYKAFDLTMLWQGAGKVSQYVFYEGGGGGIGTYTQDYFNNRWTPENPDASGPRIYDREKTSVAKQNTYFLKNASYVRLKTLQLSYSLPRNLLSKAHISNCNVFVSGFNLLTITGLKDIDPEATASGQSYSGWFNIQNKVYNFGLNLTF